MTFFLLDVDKRSLMYLQGESCSLCWLTLNPLTWKIWWAPNNASRWQMGCNSVFKGLTKGKQLCKGMPSWTQLYCLIYINISTTCFGPYGHLQVGYEIRCKTIYNMVHYIHECGVKGDEISFTKMWRACRIIFHVQPEDGHKGRNM